MVSSKQKGSQGERKFCNWIYDELALHEKPQRNLEQVRNGGTDILLGVTRDEPHFCVEVKNRTVVDYQTFWVQAACDARLLELEPVVAITQPRREWEFLISAKLIKCDRGWLHINHRVFLEYAADRLGTYVKRPLRNKLPHMVKR